MGIVLTSYLTILDIDPLELPRRMLQVVQKVVYMEVFTMTTHLQRSTGVEQTMKCKMFGFNIPFYLPISDLYQISEPIFCSSKLQTFYNLPICTKICSPALVDWAMFGYNLICQQNHEYAP